MGCKMYFSKWQTEILHDIEYLFFFTIMMSFLEKKNFPEFTFCGPIIFVINVSFLTKSSATVKMDNEENMENVRYATNDDTPL